MKLNRANLYVLCTAVILGGFLMLIQPLSMSVFSLGLPVMIAGIVLHIILDHMSDPVPEPGAERDREGTEP
jgi:hypothetical protein